MPFFGYFVAGLIVLLAILYLARCLRKAWKGEGGSCCSCESKDACGKKNAGDHCEGSKKE